MSVSAELRGMYRMLFKDSLKIYLTLSTSNFISGYVHMLFTYINTLHYITLPYVPLHYTTLHTIYTYTKLHYIAYTHTHNYITLYTLHYITLLYITLHYIT